MRISENKQHMNTSKSGLCVHNSDIFFEAVYVVISTDHDSIHIISQNKCYKFGQTLFS